MTNIRRGMIAALALALSGVSTAALAEFKPSAELRSACMGDAMKLCSSYLTNMDGLLSCMTAKKSQASPRCQAQFDADMKKSAQK